MPGLLDGVKVISFAQVVGTPAATAVLADWGADVIKIEPFWGDWQRSLVSFNRTPLLLNLEKGEIELLDKYIQQQRNEVIHEVPLREGIYA